MGIIISSEKMKIAKLRKTKAGHQLTLKREAIPLQILKQIAPN